MKSMLSVCLFAILFSAIRAEVESEDNVDVKADIISTLTKNAETNLNRARRAAPNPTNCVEFTDRSSGKKFLQCEDAPLTTSVNVQMPPMVPARPMGMNQPMQRQWLQRSSDDDMATFLQAPQPVNKVGSSARGAYYDSPAPAAPVQGYGPCPQKMLFSCQPTVVSVPCQPDSYAAPSYSSYSAPAPSYSAPAPSYSAPAPSYSAPAPAY